MLFLAVIVYSGLIFFVTFKLFLTTNISTAWPLMPVNIVLGLLAFLLSLWMEKESHFTNKTMEKIAEATRIRV